MEKAYNEPDENSGPSNSQLKREMTALQDLGAELATLSKERLAKIDMPEGLLDAQLDTQRSTMHEAKRRQMQYVSKIMCDIDTAPLQAAMGEMKGNSNAATVRQHRLENLRTSWLEDGTRLSELARHLPTTDIQLPRQLRRSAIEDAQQDKPPRAYRELFR